MSTEVVRAIEARWTVMADGAAAVAWFKFDRGPRAGVYRIIHLYAGNRRIEVTISPTGRSVQVYVDGEEVVAS